MPRPSTEQWVSSTILRRTVLGPARMAGVDTDGFLRRLAVDPSMLDDPEAWLPAALVDDFLAGLGVQLGHAAPGLWIAERVGPEAGDVLGYAMRTAPTLGEAYRTAATYFGLVGSGLEVYYHERDGSGRITHAVAPELVGDRRHRDELILGTLFNLGRRIVTDPWIPVRVSFQHAAPEDTSVHRKFFGIEVHFGEPVSELVLRAEDTRLASHFADEVLHEILSRYATALLRDDPDHPPVLREHRQAILQSLPAGELTLEAVGRRLHTSPRTLQRRLRELGTSHTELVRQTRYYLAEEYLRSPELSIDEVSFLLGYANTPAFTRAFRGWAGLSPTEYRSRERGARG